MKAGLIAGSVAAVVVVLLSLPLRSPDDVLLNSATIAIGVLVLGAFAGAVWRALADAHNSRTYFRFVMVGTFVLFTAIVVISETQLEKMISFSIPLGTVAFSVKCGYFAFSEIS